MNRFKLIGIIVLLLGAKGNYGQSLARMKKVTMSSENGNNVGANAVDGIYNRQPGSCRTDCCAAIHLDAYDVHPWLEIDLGENNTFTRIVLYGQTDANFTQQSLNSLSLYLDSNRVASTCIYNTEEMTHSFCHFKLGHPYSARYIKLQLRGFDKTLLLCEVDVFNDAIISESRETSSSSTYSDWISALAVDGLMPTNDLDASQCCARTVLDTDPWLTVDLGDTFLVTFIQIHGRTNQDYDGQSFDGMKIQLDGTDIYTVPNGKFLNYFEILPVPEKIGRRVRFILVGSNRALVICEVAIYGERVISIRKHASISTTYSDWDASRAVDGDYRTLPDLNSCTASTHQKDPYLRIHFGNAHRVTRIAIYGRTDGEFPNQNFEGMLIGSTNAFTRNVTAQEPGQWIDFFAFQLSTTILVSEITVTLPGVNQQLVVCELLIYGDCSDGYFGQGCSRQCHCEGLTCDTITGVCPSLKCTPGYTGLTCSEECQTGTYGFNCEQRCGMCTGGDVCDIYTGVCQNGCTDGYKGDQCLQKMNQETSIGLVVIIGSLFGVIFVITIVLDRVFYRKRLNSKSANNGYTIIPVPKPNDDEWSFMEID